MDVYGVRRKSPASTTLERNMKLAPMRQTRPGDRRAQVPSASASAGASAGASSFYKYSTVQYWIIATTRSGAYKR